MLTHPIHYLLKLFYPLVRRILPYQVYAYLSVGALNTLLNIGLFVVVLRALKGTDSDVEIATITAFTITVITGFWLQRSFAFTNALMQGDQLKNQFLRYSLVALQGQVSSYLLLKGMILLLHIEATTAYIVTTVIMLILNYILQKYFAFRHP